MKMKQDHYNQLASMIHQAIEESRGAFVVQEYQNKGISMMRYRWDLYHVACSKDSYRLANELYQYCNDDNIDTALRNITNTK